jgi:V/A-type H+-transporting ATPase subunit C
MAGGVSGYGAVSARVRVKYSNLLGEGELHALGEAEDFAALVDALKRSTYGPDMEAQRERELSAAEVIRILRMRQASEAHSVIQATPGTSKRVVIQLFRRHEVNNLKAVLRAIATGGGVKGDGSAWERVKALLFPLGTQTQIPAEAMLESGAIPAAVELLRGTPYYETLTFALKRYSAEQSLFPLEVALDLDHWRKLWAEAHKLAGQDQAQALRVIGALVDASNLMWAIRYRVYKHLSEEEMINYTLPFGQRVHDEHIRAIAAGADIGSVVERLYPEVDEFAALLSDPRSGLPRLEIELKRVLARRCMAAFLGDPFHVGLPLAFIILHDLEIQDLIVLLEAKSTHVKAEEFRPYLLGAAAAPA